MYTPSLDPNRLDALARLRCRLHLFDTADLEGPTGVYHRRPTARHRYGHRDCHEGNNT